MPAVPTLAGASHQLIGIGREPVTHLAATGPTGADLCHFCHGFAPNRSGRGLALADQGAEWPPAKVAAMRSAIISVGRWVLARGTAGITDASHTTNPS